MTASFIYDGLGRRETKNISGSRTEFLFDGVNPVQETDGATILANILPGLRIDEIFTRSESAGTRSFLSDALGSTLALTDSVGAVQTEYTYEPFGKTTVSGAATTSPFQFTGRENDGTGLYCYRARYYHPVFQRFISEDPLQCHHNRRSDKNLYAYVRNNPLRYTDPLGLTEHDSGGSGTDSDDGGGGGGTGGRKDPPPPGPPPNPPRAGPTRVSEKGGSNWGCFIACFASIYGPIGWECIQACNTIPPIPWWGGGRHVTPAVEVLA